MTIDDSDLEQIFNTATALQRLDFDESETILGAMELKQKVDDIASRIKDVVQRVASYNGKNMV